MSIYTVGFIYPKDFIYNFRCYLTLTHQNGKVVYLNWHSQTFSPADSYEKLLTQIEAYKKVEMQSLLQYVSKHAYAKINVFDTCIFNAEHERSSRSFEVSNSDKFIFRSEDLYFSERIELVTSSAYCSSIPDLLEGL